MQAGLESERVIDSIVFIDEPFNCHGETLFYLLCSIYLLATYSVLDAMQQLELIVFIKEAAMQREPGVATARAASTEVAMFANWTILAWATACPVHMETAHVIYGTSEENYDGH